MNYRAFTNDSLTTLTIICMGMAITLPATTMRTMTTAVAMWSSDALHTTHGWRLQPRQVCG
jgi:hypothetical protein